MAEVVRIYSTSGTTGAPSYFPLTGPTSRAGSRSPARSYAASGVAAGAAADLHLWRGAVRGRRGARRLRRARALPHPAGARGTPRGSSPPSQALAPDAVALTPLLRAAPGRDRRRPRASTWRRPASARLLVAGEPGGGEPEMRARLEAAWGAQVTEAMGIGDVAVSLWGECEGRAGMHFSGPRPGACGADRPRHGAALRPGRRGRGGAGLYPPPPSRRAAAALPQPRPRARAGRRLRLRAHQPRGCAASAAPTTCWCCAGSTCFPSAVREVVAGFAPAVSGVIAIRPRRRGVRQAPPLPVVVELAEGRSARPALADAIRGRLRERAGGQPPRSSWCRGGACRAATTSRSWWTGPGAGS